MLIIHNSVYFEVIHIFCNALVICRVIDLTAAVIQRYIGLQF
jgi:hypothetical protein